jgi:hypothetical protein
VKEISISQPNPEPREEPILPQKAQIDEGLCDHPGWNTKLSNPPSACFPPTAVCSDLIEAMIYGCVEWE